MDSNLRKTYLRCLEQDERFAEDIENGQSVNQNMMGPNYFYMVERWLFYYENASISLTSHRELVERYSDA